MTFQEVKFASQLGEEAAPPVVRYMPQLDSLRAIAALGVFAQHFLASSHICVSVVPMGDLGVRLFFVLSGFLITLILLNARDKNESSSAGRKRVMRSFYARRFLRLLPPYLVFLAVVFVLYAGARDDSWWFFAYLQNIHFALNDGFTVAAHTWTLAVEEQFYLLWPFVIVFLPRRAVVPVLIATVAFGMVSRLIFVGLGMSHFQASMLMPAHLDTLGIGALLAVYARASEGNVVLEKYLYAALVAGAVILGGVLYAKIMGLSEMIEFIFGELGSGLIFVAVISIAAKGFRGVIGWILDRPALQYLGKISYGMYLYHMLAPVLCGSVLGLFGISIGHRGYLPFVTYTLVAIGIAAASWHLLEQPILQLKRRFSYSGVQDMEAEGSSATVASTQRA